MPPRGAIALAGVLGAATSIPAAALIFRQRGACFAIGPEVDNLNFMKRTADRLFGEDCRWSVLGAGGAQMRLAITASQMGGNVRVGLEDRLLKSRGKLVESNAQQVAKIRRIVEDLGCDVATPDETREILALKGGDRVNF